MNHHYKYYLRLLWVKMMRLGSLSGYHQLPERSFSFHGYQFPVCARCCGVLIGELLAVILLILHYIISIPIALACMFIMFVDWFIQYIEIKKSNNTRRFLTGILGGLGSWSVFIYLAKKVAALVLQKI